MFHDLDSTLRELLQRELPRDLVEQVSVCFSTPDGQSLPAWVTLPAVNLFLYGIQPNRELRTAEPSIERQVDGSVLRTPAPARVDCLYLVTAWAKAGVQQPEQDEHRILGETMRVLLRHRQLPTEALRGSLKSQALPLRAMVQSSGDELGRGDFWQALGGKPRAAFGYLVTIEVPVDMPENVGKVVVETSSGS